MPYAICMDETCPCTIDALSMALFLGCDVSKHFDHEPRSAKFNGHARGGGDAVSGASTEFAGGARTVHIRAANGCILLDAAPRAFTLTPVTLAIDAGKGLEVWNERIISTEARLVPNVRRTSVVDSGLDRLMRMELSLVFCIRRGEHDNEHDN
jgi:hypothetical protein